MSNTPSIYVGTYAKYNNGSLFGEWLELDDYSDVDEFYKACAEKHNDENDAEYMFQDWENIPDEFISESHIKAEFWEYMDIVASSCYSVEVFNAASNLALPYNMVEELYQGEHDSDENFAQQLAENVCALKSEIHWPYTHIDWERAAYDLMMDYSESDGHYFRTSY